MINLINYSINSIVFIEGYDGVTYKFWSENSTELVGLRAEIRKHYLAEQGYVCAYCRCEHLQTHGFSWDIDHIIPKSRYPKYLFEPANLIISCKDCNTAKGDYDPLIVTKGINKIYPPDGTYFNIIHPHYDKYEEYIEVFVLGRRRLYIPEVGHEKATNTIIRCNLIRYSWKFAGAANFRDEIVSAVSKFINSCNVGDSAEKIISQMGHLKFD